MRNERNIVVRTSAVFGDGSNFIKAILGAAATRRGISVVADQWCQPTDATQLARAIVGLVQRDASGVFHVAGNPPCTWAAFAEAVLEAANSTATVTHITTDDYVAGRSEPTAPRPLHAVLDCSKARDLGIEPEPWRTSVARYVDKIS